MSERLKYYILAGILLAGILVFPSSAAPCIVPRTEDSYVCYDYSVNFMQHNPDWGCVTMSDQRFFYGVSHMVNFKIGDNNSIDIHDGMWGLNYTIENIHNNTRYYHFWPKNSTPIRTYKFLRDNRNELNTTTGGN